MIESRLSWVIQIATSMMNLNYAPLPNEGEQNFPHEGDLSLKIIEVLKLTNELEKQTPPY